MISKSWTQNRKQASSGHFKFNRTHPHGYENAPKFRFGVKWISWEICRVADVNDFDGGKVAGSPNAELNLNFLLTMEKFQFNEQQKAKVFIKGMLGLLVSNSICKISPRREHSKARKEFKLMIVMDVEKFIWSFFVFFVELSWFFMIYFWRTTKVYIYKEKFWVGISKESELRIKNGIGSRFIWKLGIGTLLVQIQRRLVCWLKENLVISVSFPLRSNLRRKHSQN